MVRCQDSLVNRSFSRSEILDSPEQLVLSGKFETYANILYAEVLRYRRDVSTLGYPLQSRIAALEEGPGSFRLIHIIPTRDTAAPAAVRGVRGVSWIDFRRDLKISDLDPQAHSLTEDRALRLRFKFDSDVKSRDFEGTEEDRRRSAIDRAIRAAEDLLKLNVERIHILHKSLDAYEDEPYSEMTVVFKVEATNEIYLKFLLTVLDKIDLKLIRPYQRAVIRF